MMLWGLAAGVVLLLGVVLFLVLRSGGQEPVETTPSPTISLTDDDSAIGDGVYDPPVLTADATPGGVRFSWNYPGIDKGDTYRLLVATEKSKLNDAKPEVLKVTTKTVSVPKGTQLCATVVVNRGGAASPPSEVRCETAL